MRKGATPSAPKGAANGGHSTPKSRRKGSTIQTYLSRSSQKHGRGPLAPAGSIGGKNKTKPKVNIITLDTSQTGDIKGGGGDTITPKYHNNTLPETSVKQNPPFLKNKKNNNANTVPPVAKAGNKEKKATTPKQTKTRKKNVVVVADKNQQKITEMFNKSSKPVSSPSITSAKKVSCSYNKNGFCKQHRAIGQIRIISSLELQDRGEGRGMGLVKTKKEKYFCNPKKLLPKASNIPTVSNNEVFLSNGLVTSDNKLEGNNMIGQKLLLSDYEEKGLAGNGM